MNAQVKELPFTNFKVRDMGLAELGRSSRLYDGSWAEWGARTDTPVETG
jgi:3-mercaptopyruvate sulfurtransferase SseA